MKHYTGFYYCTRSNWDGEMFDVGNLVAVERKSEDFNNTINKVCTKISFGPRRCKIRPNNLMRN